MPAENKTLSDFDPLAILADCEHEMTTGEWRDSKEPAWTEYLDEMESETYLLSSYRHVALKLA